MTEETAQSNEKSNGGLGGFITETRREISKVTWPTRKEISMTTTMIVVFALITGVFFLVVDWALGFVVSRILGMHS